MKTGFTIRDSARRSAVTALFSAIDFSKTGLNDVVVGREDGSLEMYDLDDAGAPQLLTSVQAREKLMLPCKVCRVWMLCT